jgi:hypothetical protein
MENTSEIGYKRNKKRIKIQNPSLKFLPPQKNPLIPVKLLFIVILFFFVPFESLSKTK